MLLTKRSLRLRLRSLSLASVSEKDVLLEKVKDTNREELNNLMDNLQYVNAKRRFNHLVKWKDNILSENVDEGTKRLMQKKLFDIIKDAPSLISLASQTILIDIVKVLGPGIGSLPILSHAFRDGWNIEYSVIHNAFLDCQQRGDWKGALELHDLIPETYYDIRFLRTTFTSLCKAGKWKEAENFITSQGRSEALVMNNCGLYFAKMFILMHAVQGRWEIAGNYALSLLEEKYKEKYDSSTCADDNNWYLKDLKLILKSIENKETFPFIDVLNSLAFLYLPVDMVITSKESIDLSIIHERMHGIIHSLIENKILFPLLYESIRTKYFESNFTKKRSEGGLYVSNNSKDYKYSDGIIISKSMHAYNRALFSMSQVSIAAAMYGMMLENMEKHKQIDEDTINILYMILKKYDLSRDYKNSLELLTYNGVPLNKLNLDQINFINLTEMKFVHQIALILKYAKSKISENPEKITIVDDVVYKQMVTEFALNIANSCEDKSIDPNRIGLFLKKLSHLCSVSFLSDVLRVITTQNSSNPSIKILEKCIDFKPFSTEDDALQIRIKHILNVLKNGNVEVAYKIMESISSVNDIDDNVFDNAIKSSFVLGKWSTALDLVKLLGRKEVPTLSIFSSSFSQFVKHKQWESAFLLLEYFFDNNPKFKNLEKTVTHQFLEALVRNQNWLMAENVASRVINKAGHYDMIRESHLASIIANTIHDGNINNISLLRNTSTSYFNEAMIKCEKNSYTDTVFKIFSYLETAPNAKYDYISFDIALEVAIRNKEWFHVVKLANMSLNTPNISRETVFQSAISKLLKAATINKYNNKVYYDINSKIKDDESINNSNFGEKYHAEITYVDSLEHRTAKVISNILLSFPNKNSPIENFKVHSLSGENHVIFGLEYIVKIIGTDESLELLSSSLKDYYAGGVKKGKTYLKPAGIFVESLKSKSPYAGTIADLIALQTKQKFKDSPL